MSATERHLFSVLGGPTAARRVASSSTLVEGKVAAVTAAGMTFTLPWFDGGKHTFGPCPWPKSRTEPAGTGPHDHAESVPPAGARCLVALGVPSETHTGGGVGNAWVLAVWW